MINFAEDLIYWYFRFNGFFLLQNFVLHKKMGQVEGERVRGTAESDLLAIRFPYVCEDIGGKKNDWDCKQFKNWGIEIDEFNLAFIVEVTSSQNVSRNNLMGKFSCERLKQAVRRFGIFPRDEISCIVKSLYQKDKYIKDPWIIAKLAVTERNISSDLWLNLSLAQADKFIQGRIESYSSEKYSDRTYFPDALIQYLAWKGYNNPQKNYEGGK